jgi:hypothetical protein
MKPSLVPWCATVAAALQQLAAFATIGYCYQANHAVLPLWLGAWFGAWCLLFIPMLLALWPQDASPTLGIACRKCGRELRAGTFMSAHGICGPCAVADTEYESNIPAPDHHHRKK